MSLPRPDDPTPAQRWRVSAQTIVLGAAALLISLTTMVLAYAWLDFSLGLAFMAPVCAMLCALPLGAAIGDWRASVTMALLIAVGTSMPLCLAASSYAGFAGASVQLAVLCFAIALLAIELPRLVSRTGLHATISGALLLMIAGVWMSLPVWMSPHFSEPWGEWVIDHVLGYQPLIAINGAFATLGDWSHQPLAYTWLTSLGQDVPFAFPPTAWGCAFIHLSIAVLALAVNALLQICQKTPGPTR